MFQCRRVAAGLRAVAAALVLAAPACAGGGPTNVLVLVNDESPDSLAIANHYRCTRGIPAGNVCHLRVPVKIEMPAAEFETSVLTPLRTWLRTAPAAPNIRYLVVTEGFPYRIRAFPSELHWTGDHYVSITSALATLDARADAIRHNPMAMRVTTDWYASTQAFRGTAQLPYLAMALMGDRVEDVLHCIDQGAAADGTAPTGTVYFFKGVGPRQRLGTQKTPDQQSPVIAALAKKGIRAVKHAHAHSLKDETDVLGYYTGFTRVKTDGLGFLPGALADHLTSFGGVIKGRNGQMSCTKFIAGGATATYGTVTEPLNIFLRFPEAWLFDRYTDGFTAVESYWAAVGTPRIGIFVGEPLASPYVKRPVVTFDGLAAGGTLEAERHPAFSVSGGQGGYRRVEAWLDGVRFAGGPALRVQQGTKVTVQVGASTATLECDGHTTLGATVAALATQFPDDGPVAVSAHGRQLQLHARASGLEPNDLTWSVAIQAPVGGDTAPLAVPLTAPATSGTLTGDAPPETKRASVKLTIKGAPNVGGDQLTIAKGKEAIRVVSQKGESLVDFAKRVLAELMKTSIAYKRTPAEMGGRPGSPIPAARRGKNSLQIVLGASKNAEAGNGETITITYKKAKGSKLTVTPNGARTTSGGITVEMRARGAILFDTGTVEALAHVPLGLDAGTLASGPHRLRLVAEEAGPLGTQGWADCTFEVAREKGELRLDGPRGKPPHVVTGPFKVTPKLFRAKRGSRNKIRFLVDDLPVDGTVGNRRARSLDPKALALGRGPHTVVAEILEDDGATPFMRSAPLAIDYQPPRPPAPNAAPGTQKPGKSKPGKKRKH